MFIARISQPSHMAHSDRVANDLECSIGRNQIAKYVLVRVNVRHGTEPAQDAAAGCGSMYLLGLGFLYVFISRPSYVTA
jgi:predicted RNA methylase